MTDTTMVPPAFAGTGLSYEALVALRAASRRLLGTHTYRDDRGALAFRTFRRAFGPGFRQEVWRLLTADEDPFAGVVAEQPTLDGGPASPPLPYDPVAGKPVAEPGGGCGHDDCTDPECDHEDNEGTGCDCDACDAWDCNGDCEQCTNHSCAQCWLDRDPCDDHSCSDCHPEGCPDDGLRRCCGYCPECEKHKDGYEGDYRCGECNRCSECEHSCEY